MGNSGSNTVAASYVKELFAKKIATTAGIKSYHAIMRSKGRDHLYQKLADACSLHDIDPRPFMDWAFEEIYPGLPPCVSCLMPAIDRYVGAGKPDLQYKKISVLMQNMLNRLKRCKENNDPIEFMLDPLNEFSLVFVYCIANKLGVADRLPADIVEGAKEELFLKPIYKARFSNFLPAGDSQ
jgi:hypothetical protein